MSETNIKNIDKLQPSYQKKNILLIKINKTKDERGYIATDTVEIWGIIKKCLKTRIPQSWKSSKEMDKFLDVHIICQY